MQKELVVGPVVFQWFFLLLWKEKYQKIQLDQNQILGIQGSFEINQ